MSFSVSFSQPQHWWRHKPARLRQRTTWIPNLCLSVIWYCTYVLRAPCTQFELSKDNAQPRTVHVHQHTHKQNPRNFIQLARNYDQFLVVEKYVLWHPLEKLIDTLLSLLLWQDRRNQSQGQPFLKYWIKSNACSLLKLYQPVLQFLFDLNNQDRFYMSLSPVASCSCKNVFVLVRLLKNI